MIGTTYRDPKCLRMTLAMEAKRRQRLIERVHRENMAVVRRHLSDEERREFDERLRREAREDRYGPTLPVDSFAT
jgi:hypothetical protein